MSEHEYLVSYGRAGDFGRFRPAASVDVSRGDRVILLTHQGLEVGTVLCHATQGHARFLSRTALGEILRLASAADERAAEQARAHGQRLFETARRFARELAIPLEVVDVEMLFDGQQAILYYVADPACDPRPLVSRLSRECRQQIVPQNVSVPKEPEDTGCGRPDCDKTKNGGGCNSCGSGGCGTCSAGTRKEDITTFLAGLRQRMST